MMILGVILSMLLILWTFAGTAPQSREDLHELSDGWYLMQDGARVEVTLPIVRKADTKTILTLYNDSLTAADAGMTLTTRGALYRLRILLDGEPLYEYRDGLFPRNEQMRTKLDCTVNLPGETAGKNLTLVYEIPDRREYQIPRVYIGTASAVFRHYCLADAFTLAIVFVMLVMSLIAVWISLYSAKSGIRDRRFADAACFLLLCGAWCILDSSLAQYLSDMSPAVCYLSFYAFMTLPIPILHFVQNTGEMARYRILDLCILLFYLNAALQGLLCRLGFFELIEMLFVTHILLAVGASVLCGLIIREYLRKRTRELLVVLVAFATLSLSGVLALLLYWLLGIPYYGLIFECGILVFIVILLNGLIATMAGTLRFKTEALVYQRLSREDRLTGLRNRRAFEQFLETLEREAGSWENVALVFMDLNGLKHINDHFGHSAGDELIIGAARCIERAFAGYGECYRIGGDEFCAILPDPVLREEEWNALLDEEIQRHNQSSRFKLSIARGASRLRDAAGVLKTVSDWKFEADQMMYQDKESRKMREK